MSKEFYFLKDDFYGDGADPKLAVFQVAAMRPDALEALADAIAIRRNALMVERLRRAGFHANHSRLMSTGEMLYFSLIVVRPEECESGGEWFTRQEAQRLLDTAANLPAAEAYQRMMAKIDSVAIESYTEDQARADTLGARQRLQRRAEETEMSAEDFALEWASTSFMNLV